MKYLPDVCMSRLHTTGEPIFIRLGEIGYYQATFDYDPDAFNRRFNITPAQVAAMEFGSMFGWHTPGANPNSDMYSNLETYPYRDRLKKAG